MSDEPTTRITPEWLRRHAESQSPINRVYPVNLLLDAATEIEGLHELVRHLEREIGLRDAYLAGIGRLEGFKQAHEEADRLGSEDTNGKSATQIIMEDPQDQEAPESGSRLRVMPWIGADPPKWVVQDESYVADGGWSYSVISVHDTEAEAVQALRDIVQARAEVK